MGLLMLAAEQIVRFIVVGVITTAVDFLVFNLLTGRRWGWQRIPANIVSVTAAMIWAFLANWFLVFQPDGDAWLDRAGRFLVTTAFSAFVLQNAVLYLTTYRWKRPVDLALLVARTFGLDRRLGEDVISRNTCKALAVSIGLVWNFCFYKFFVYAG
jgi:putative flippase GtrA